jgi:hypothetical protein
MKVIERLTVAEIQLRSPPVVTAAASNDSLQLENSMRFGALRTSAPRLPIDPFFPLLPPAPLPHFLALASFGVHHFMCPALRHSLGMA